MTEHSVPIPAPAGPGNAVSEPLPLEPAGSSEPLDSPDVGLRVIRGGVIRVAGYGVGTLLAAVASVMLLRYLGVAGFGRFATVTSLVAIVGGLSDAGLSSIGARDLARRPPGRERDRLLSNLLGLRLVLTPLGVLGALVFAVAAGFDRTLIVGTLLAGAGLILMACQGTLALPLYVDVHPGRITALDVLQQVVTLAGVALLVAAGAGLAPFFAIAVCVGVLVLAVTPLMVGRGFVWRPAFQREEWRPLVRDMLPLAAATVVNVAYFQMLILLMSVLTTAASTGLFATSFRITQMLLGISSLVLTIVVPVLAVAAADRARLRYIFGRLLEVAVITSFFLAIVVAILAVPILDLLGGDEYRAAAPVLRVQVFALIPLFVGQACGVVLVAIRRQGIFLASGGAALGLVLVGGLILIPPYEANGAAVAALIAETGLTTVLLGYLLTTSPDLRPDAGFLWKVALAAALAGGCALLPVPAVAAGTLAAVVYIAAVWLTGALPPEVFDAVGARRRA